MHSKRKAKVPEARSARKVAKLNAIHRMIKDYMRADGVCKISNGPRAAIIRRSG
jgi:hypothetical protein